MAEIDFDIRLKTFRIIQKNEPSTDEPYLLVIRVLVDGSNLTWNGSSWDVDPFVDIDGSHADLGVDDVEKGTIVTIPTKLGRWKGTLRTIEDGLFAEEASVFIGVAALEEDASSGDTIRKARNAIEKSIRNTLRNRLETALAALDPNLLPDAGDLDSGTLVKKAKKVVSDSLAEAWKFTPGTQGFLFGELVNDGGDPDDFVGFGGVHYSFRDLRALMGRAPQVPQITLSAEKAKDFEGTYAVRAEVDVTDLREQDPTTIAVGHLGDDGLHIFARGMDREIYRSRWEGSGSWSGWASIGHGTFDSGPAVARIGDHGHLLVGRGDDAAGWQCVFDAGWGPWLSLDKKFIQTPVLVPVGRGSIGLLTRRIGDRRYMLRTRAANGIWNAWSVLGVGAFLTAPGACWSPEGVQVIGVGLDRRSYHGRLVGDDWQWSPMGAGTLSSAVAVITGAGGRLDAFARGDDRNVYHAAFVGGQWTDWADDVDAGPAKSATILSAPAAISRAPGTFDLFAIGDDRRIWHTYFNGATWSGWMRDTPEGTFL